MTEPATRPSIINVYFIAAWSRSGSTILDSCLGEAAGVFSLGELRYIWDRGLLDNQTCGCGQPFLVCEFWTEVIRNAFGTIDPAFLDRMIHLRNSFHSRDTLRSLFPWWRRSLTERYRDYLSAMEQLYLTLGKLTGARAFVDSSKFPSHGYLLGLIESLDVRVVHLVRDPRAVAFSWGREKVFDTQKDPTVMIGRQSPFRSTLMWSFWNFLIELLWARRDRYVRVTYEQFVNHPTGEINRVLGMIPGEGFLPPMIEDGQIQIGTHHTVSGNPTRFRTGTVKLKLDAEWQSDMRPVDRLLVELVSFPYLLQYGYSL